MTYDLCLYCCKPRHFVQECKKKKASDKHNAAHSKQGKGLQQGRQEETLTAYSKRGYNMSSS